MTVPNRVRGYTIVELMVVVVIVAVLATTVGAFVVKLLTLQEQDREEAYIREKLAEICGAYADDMSLGSVISNCVDYGRRGFNVGYRQETGGVSLETGRVFHVMQLSSFSQQNIASYLNRSQIYTNLTLSISARDAMGLPWNPPPSVLRGDDTPLLTVKDLKMNDYPVSLTCRIDPLNSYSYEGDTALWRLQVKADYVVKHDKGVFVFTNATAERVVRLWNRE